jgi:hypothetical protein
MATDPASFASGNVPDLQRKFVQKLAADVARCCAKRLTRGEMELCVREAASGSGWGRFVLGHNYWMLPGRGNAGAFLLVRLRHDAKSVGGVVPVIDKYAKFTDIASALDAWCRRRGK